ncbi:hypothetical protein [Dysgonomonas macrotermitis]|uniref:Lipocalin-like domain-containing protein n=1 Tax=Dysgonomonas macrotermitis TaxID=1346286 RepID=A0A1M4U0D7_9BACT|nr:hypothetical protein [Dysgonomonas macrotermitis]SHE50169.1 hypothetical protein SAMN05444362_101471 [Dysgonomonas macrotermitis]
MNKRLLSIAKIAILLLSVTTLFSACGEDKEYYYDSTDIYQRYIVIQANQWKWNSEYSRYEATGNLDGFSQTQYDDAAIVVSTFWTEGNTEIQTSLPYVRTWVDNNNIKYNETIGYELITGSRTITFYIQNSDMLERPSSKIDYEFKFTAIKYF